MRPVVLIALCLAMASCLPSVQFHEPMPPNRVNLPNIPKMYRGTIQDGNSVWRIGKDTVTTGDTLMVNGVDFLLRKMNGALIVSVPVPETGSYNVAVIQNDGNEMTAHFFEENPAFLSAVDSVLTAPRETKQASGMFGWEYQLLAPTAAEFGRLLGGGLLAHDGSACPLPNGGVVKSSVEIRPSN